MNFPLTLLFFTCIFYRLITSLDTRIVTESTARRKYILLTFYLHTSFYDEAESNYCLYCFLLVLS